MRKTMIDNSAKLSVSRQAILLGISRGSVYYQLRPGSDADLMHRIDKLHMEFSFAGSRMLQGLLVQEGFMVGRLHVATLMKRMGIEALYRKPNTSRPAPGHKIYPYLLRKLAVIRPNQVWAMDITYIPMARGFISLAALLDWFTRRVLSWRVSITLEAYFCIEAVEEALAKHGEPEIFNTDQGSQFTSNDFIKVLAEVKGRGHPRAFGAFVSATDRPVLPRSLSLSCEPCHAHRGGARSRWMVAKMARTVGPVTATSASWKVMARAWRTTRAPILISFTWMLVSDQSAMASDSSMQRRKLARF